MASGVDVTVPVHAATWGTLIIVDPCQDCLAAAREEAPPCPCKSAHWPVGGCRWEIEWTDPVSLSTHAPGEPCPRCGDPLPPKPAAPKADPEPCPCKSAEWDGCWTWDDREGRPRHYNPGKPCPLCGDPLPPKPVQHMSTEECMDECPADWSCRRGRSLLTGYEVVDLLRLRGSGHTVLAAWREATLTHRREQGGTI